MDYHSLYKYYKRSYLEIKQQLKQVAGEQKDFKTVSSSSYSTEKPYHFKQLSEIISKYIDTEHKHQVLDLNAHIGGFCIRWAMDYLLSNVTAIEYDKEIYAVLNENIDSFGTTNLKVLEGDSFQIVTTDLTKTKFDFIYMDPPWIAQHGTKYKYLREIDLFYGKHNAIELIKFILSKNISPLIFFKIPRNYRFESLNTENSIKYKTYNIWGDNLKKTCPDYLLLVICKSI